MTFTTGLEDGKDIVAYGGASFAQSLIEVDVVDDYRFLIHPVILGSGLPVFTKAKGMMSSNSSTSAAFRRVLSRTFTTGSMADSGCLP
jgi:dihydrofolate reductase